jgi:single-strand DNA-binding protein
MNVVCLVGRLCGDPELKYSQAGVAIATMRIAVPNPFKKDDNGKIGADFFTVVAWRQTAEFISNYGEKGREVEVDGRLQTREWVGQDGTKRSVIEISANNMRLVGPKPPNGDQGPTPDEVYGDQ